MEDKGIDFSKPPPESEPPTTNRSIIQSLLSRQSGVRSKSGTVPTELQWAAEDKMIMRNHEEYVSFWLEFKLLSNTRFWFYISGYGNSLHIHRDKVCVILSQEQFFVNNFLFGVK